MTPKDREAIRARAERVTSTIYHGVTTLTLAHDVLALLDTVDAQDKEIMRYRQAFPFAAFPEESDR